VIERSPHENGASASTEVIRIDVNRVDDSNRAILTQCLRLFKELIPVGKRADRREPDQFVIPFHNEQSRVTNGP
jgi:hypothetical protein|tara:strand:- start:1347 stop:1568 length:222 start_codon:yes stop_codon:yes gene_type:complete